METIGERIKFGLALWLYRQGLVNGIVGTFITLLTFVGVYTVALGDWMTQQFGFSYLQTFVLVAALTFSVFFGGGYVLDKHVRYWEANTKVATSRNQYLRENLYMKELMQLRTSTLPQLKAARMLVASLNPSTEVEREARRAFLSELDASVVRIEAAVRTKRWDARPDEVLY